MSEPLFSLEEIAEAFKYIQDDKLSIDAKAMLTMDIGYEKAEKDIIKLLEACPKDEQWHLDNLMCCEGRCDLAIQDYQEHLIALIEGKAE